MPGRLVTEYEPWLTGEMFAKPDIEFTAGSFAEMKRQNYQVYAMEDEQGPSAVLRFMIPPDYSLMLGYSIWIRPDLRTVTFTLDDIFNEVIALTGVTLMVSKIAKYIMDDGKKRGMPPLPVIRPGEPKFPGYYHGDMYVHPLPE